MAVVESITESQAPLPEYKRWEQVPDDLKTKTALGQEGLRLARGAKPVAVIRYMAYDIERAYFLYSKGAALPKRVQTQEQKARSAANLLKARTCVRCNHAQPSVKYLNKAKVCDSCREWEQWQSEWHLDRDREIRKARRRLQKRDFVVLDTETVDLYGAVIEIAVIDPDGNPLLDTLLHPGSLPEKEEGSSWHFSATHIHGITPADVEHSPTFAQIWPDLSRILRGKRILAYGREYDQEVLKSEIQDMFLATMSARYEDKPTEEQYGCAKYGKTHDGYYDCRLNLLDAMPEGSPERERWNANRARYDAAVADYQRRDNIAFFTTKAWLSAPSGWGCLKLAYAAFYGEQHHYYGGYRWQALGGGHRALGDAREALDLLWIMAEAKTQNEIKEETAS